MTQKKEKEYKEVSEKDLCNYSGLSSTSSYIDESVRKTKKNKRTPKRD